MLLTLSNLAYRPRRARLSLSLGPGACLLLIGNDLVAKRSMLLDIARLNRPASTTEHATYSQAEQDILSLRPNPTPPAPPQILYNRIDIETSPLEYKTQIGYLPRLSLHLYEKRLTLLDNLRYWAKIYNSEAALDLVIELCSLSPLLDTPCCELSASAIKLMCLAQCLMLNSAPIWLMEEPFTDFIDKKAAKHIAKLIGHRCAQRGIVIITCSREQIDLLKKHLDAGSVNHIEVNLDRL